MRSLALSLFTSCALLAPIGDARASEPDSRGRGDPKDAEIARLRDALERAVSGKPKSSDKAAPAKTGPSKETPEQIWEGLLEGNRRFVSGKPKAREYVGTRKRLAAGQSPSAIVLACADSRVGPELLFDQTLGDLFVVRTAGNVADAVALGSIEYAVEHLHAKLIVVLGHESCGAVAAADAGGDPKSPNLRAIVSRIRPAIEKLDVCGTGPIASRLKIEANVVQSARDLLSSSAVLREALGHREIAIVPAVYALATGEIARVDQAINAPAEPQRSAGPAKRSEPADHGHSARH